MRTYAECFLDVMCRPSEVHLAETAREPHTEPVTVTVHDPDCTRSAFMHGLVDLPCMVHLTITRKG
jgi:hypothetical protein